MAVSYDLSGKTAVVTGGAKGIGRAIAEWLKRSGSQVWVWDIAPGEQDGNRVTGYAFVLVTDQYPPFSLS